VKAAKKRSVRSSTKIRSRARRSTIQFDITDLGSNDVLMLGNLFEYIGVHVDTTSLEDK